MLYLPLGAPQHTPGACTEHHAATHKAGSADTGRPLRCCQSRSSRLPSRAAVRRRGHARRWRSSGGRTADFNNGSASCQAAIPLLCFSSAFRLSFGGCRDCHRRRFVDGAAWCRFGAPTAGVASIPSPLLLSRIPLLASSPLAVFSTCFPRPLFYPPCCRCAACQWRRPPHHELPIGRPQLHCRQ